MRRIKTSKYNVGYNNVRCHILKIVLVEGRAFESLINLPLIDQLRRTFSPIPEPRNGLSVVTMFYCVIIQKMRLLVGLCQCISSIFTTRLGLEKKYGQKKATSLYLLHPQDQNIKLHKILMLFSALY